MNDVVMIEAVLFQLRAAAEQIDSDYAAQFELPLSVLANAVAAARAGLNASTVNDIEFAVNDLAAAVDELPQADADRVAPLITMLHDDLAALKAATALDPSVIAALRALQQKLRERMKALERQTFVEGGTDAPLPHPPAALHQEAVPLARQLAAAGFATPALDEFIAAPDPLRLHAMRDIIDELDVIAG
jgi:hypothetical protein